MRVAAALSLSLAAACVPAVAAKSPAPLRVTNGDRPFGYDDGAPARKLAEADCVSRGQSLRPSIYDRFEAGAWVFVEGCA